MKRTILTMMIAASMTAVSAQTTDSTATRQDTLKRTGFHCELAEQMPVFPGGEGALKKYLSDNIKYPELAAQYGVEGVAIMHFVVGEDGTVKDITAKDCKIVRFNTTKFSQEVESRQKELKKQFALLFAKEAYRVIRKMPKWEPGRINGKIVSVKYTLPVKFVIPNK